MISANVCYSLFPNKPENFESKRIVIFKKVYIKNEFYETTTIL